MPLDDTPCLDRGEGDKLSRRWSIESVASSSLDTRRHDGSTESSTAPVSHDITAETLSRLPKGCSMLEENIASSTDGNFHERQVESAQEEGHLKIKHDSALTISLQQYSVILERDHTQVETQVETQAEMLTGIQMDVSADPSTGIPADLRTVLEPNSRRDSQPPPEIKVDEEAEDTHHTEGVYAKLYQLGMPGMIQFDCGLREAMRREAALDDAIFRPNLQPMKRTPLNERRLAGEDANLVSVHRTIRKRKRENKATDEKEWRFSRD